MSEASPIFFLSMFTLGTTLLLAIYQVLSVRSEQREGTRSALARRGDRSRRGA